MPITGPEPVVADVRQYIENNIQNKIDAVNDGVDDGITLDYPVEVLDFVPSQTYLQRGFPMVGLQHGRLTAEDDSGWGMTSKMDLTVVVFDLDVEVGNLAKKIMRWESVLLQTMLTPTRLIGTRAWAVVFQGLDPGPTLARREDPRDYMSLTTLTVELRWSEDVA